MAGLRVEVVIESGLFVEVGFGVGALGAVARRVGDLDKTLAVEHKARPPAVGDESPRPVDLASNSSNNLLCPSIAVQPGTTERLL